MRAVPRLSTSEQSTVQRGFIPVTITKLAGVMAVAAAMIMPRRKDWAKPVRDALMPLFAAFALWPLLGIFASGLPLPAVSFSYLISLVLLMVATRGLICTPERARNVIRASVLAAGMGAAWCYKQHFIEGAERAWGVGLDPNYEALSMVMMIPLAAWMGRAEARLLWRTVGALIAVSLAGATFLTQSRGGLIALAVVGVAALLLARRRPAARCALLVAFGAFITLAPAGLWQRFENIRISGSPLNGDETAARARLELIVAGLGMVDSHPLLGVGLDGFKAAAPGYDPRLRDSGTQYIAHNTYLQVAAETGLPGLLLYIALMAVDFGNCRAAERCARDPALVDFAAAIRLALLAYAVAGLFLTAEFVVWYWLLIFLSGSLRESSAAGLSFESFELPATAVLHAQDAAGPAIGRYA
jgi:O-antigen ligase